ncbi:MAG: hypothetical protein ACPL3A_03830 [Thermoanaerobacteraceae bacterium]
MTNINCISDCIYQKDGKCTLSNISDIKNIQKNFSIDYLFLSENNSTDCVYYIKNKNAVKSADK